MLIVGALPWVAAPRHAGAQDMEPRRWTHLPVGMNVLGVGYMYTRGDLQFDPVLRIEDADVEMHTAALTYVRSFDLRGTTARFDAQLPLQHGRWEGDVDGEPRSLTRDGMGDPRIRLSVLLAGAPALGAEEFAAYRRDHPVSTVVGAGLAMRFPLGEYMDDKLINLGSNRFIIEPQLGVLHRNGPWSFEVTGTAFVYTDNDHFFNGNELEQDPLFAVQAHVVRTFEQGWWMSVGAAYGWGGRSEINGERKDDERSNLLYGVSVGFPLSRTQSVQMGYIRRDALEDAGIDGHSVFAGWSIRF